jgi:hypothetical protein
MHRSGSRKEWLKLHTAFTGVEGYSKRGSYRRRGRRFSSAGALLNSLPLDDIETVTADAGYLSRHNCDLIKFKGAKPYIKLKKNIRVIRAFGSKARGNMILEWRANPKA